MLLLLAMSCDPTCESDPEFCGPDSDVDDSVPVVEGDLSENAYAVLSTHCASCHANGAIEGGLSYVLDRDRLVDSGKVVPYDPDGSNLLFRMESGSMPPSYANTTIDAAEVKFIRDWIDEGAPDWDDDPPRTFITKEEVFAAAYDDVVAQTDLQRPFTRYISLVHLYNAGLGLGEIEAYRTALNKLLNHLSWNPAVTNPTAVDELGLIFRINLKDYRWEPAAGDPVDAWERILRGGTDTDVLGTTAVAAPYPYAFHYDDPDFNALRDNTRSRLPIIHGDWLVNAAAIPPLYHDILRIPDNHVDFLALHGIDQVLNVANQNVVRAGFNDSGVSVNNRVVERHPGNYGYCWTSYDFLKENSFGNIFAYPLAFEEDGGEDICSLPNGMQVYWLGTAAGERLIKGPIEVVKDPNQEDSLVVNGLSCMNCHYAGMLFKTDEVWAHVSTNQTEYDPQDVQIVEALYDDVKVQSHLTDDQGQFLEAVDEAGVPRVFETEPTFALFKTFRDDMTLARVAAEVGVEAEFFKDAINDMPTALKSELTGLQTDGVNINRSTFLLISQDIIAFLEEGGAFAAEAEACGGTGIACLEGQTCLLDESDAQFGACIGEYD